MSPASRFWTAALGAGVASGAIYLFATQAPFGGGLLFHIGQLPLFVAGLAFGATATAVAGTATAGTVLMAFGVKAALVFAVLFVAPAVILVRQAMLQRQGAAGETEWYPPGLLTGWLVGIGTALVALGGAWMATKGSIEAVAKDLAEQAIDMVAMITGQPAPAGEARQQGAANLGGVFLGSMAAAMTSITAVNGVLAQGLVTRLGWNRRPSPDMASLDLPRTIPALFLFCLVAGTMLGGDLGYVLRNLLPVLVLGGVLSGLGVVHAAVRRLDGKGWLLTTVYVACVVTALPLFLLAAIGMAEPFIRLRQRIGAA